MPILERDIEVFPEDLLLRETQLEGDARWWAIYTRSRQEKELTRCLLGMEIPFYCPTVAHRYRSPAGRMRTSHIPLFTNYVFMLGDSSDRYRALQTNLISQTLEVSDGLQLTNDLRQIQQLIQLGVPFSLEARLQPGALVRIKEGPLKGVGGVVTKRKGENFLFVAVNFLQQGAVIKLQDWDVELLA